MPRISRLVLPGVPLHLVQRGNNRQACFFHVTDYAFYLESLLASANRYNVAIHAYVLMTNHVHILATPDEELGLSRMMQLLGATYVSKINATYQRTGSLWEGRFKSSLIDTSQYCLACYRYIELNPVRARIVSQPSEYRWSSYGVNALGHTNAGIVPHAQWRALGSDVEERQVRYRELVAERLDQEQVKKIRYGLVKGLPTGSGRFTTEIENALSRRLGDGRRGRPRKSLEKGL